MTETVINLPQTDAVGLSETWLFKHCGDQHWQHLCAALGVDGVNSDEMRDDGDKRLYPTFIAIRARYGKPLNVVRMDDRFHTTVKLTYFGRAFFQSTITFENDKVCFVLEMLTTFVARNQEGRNELHKTLPSSRLVYNAQPMDTPPPLLKLSQAMRHGDVTEYDFVGHHFSPREPGIGKIVAYEPSPYVDYNGAGLLYFAAYPAIADTLERQIVTKYGLVNDHRDWVLLTSTVGRDVFYYRNLDLGQRLTAKLSRFDRVGENIVIHTLLAAQDDGAALADIITAKRVLS